MAQIIPTQITPTSNWGGENSRITPTRNLNGQSGLLIEGGAQRGNNLFHSFQRFNIDTGQRVYFSNPSSVGNIFSRITGGQPSNISGTLGVDGVANLFLLNPQGVIFGAGAQLDIRGSLITTTANAIQFGSQGEFPIAPTAAPPLLNISPSALVFTANQGGIIAQGATLNLGQGLMLLGSDVSIDRSQITASGGRVELSGIQGNGSLQIQTVGEQFQIASTTGTLANVELTDNSAINVRSSDGGGDIQIRSNNLTIRRSAILAGIDGQITLNNPISLGPTIQVGMIQPGTIRPGRSPVIASSTAAPRPIAANRPSVQPQGGDIIINAQGDVVLDDRALIDNSVLANGVGNTGNTQINARNITLSNFGQITTALLGTGNLGELTLNSQNELLVVSEGHLNRQQQRRNFNRGGILRQIAATGIGNIANTSLTARNTAFLDNATLQIQNQGQGDIGHIDITANKTIRLNRINRSSFSPEINLRVDPTGQGRLGTLNLKANALSLDNLSIISSRILGQGELGDISIDVETNVNLTDESGITTATFNAPVGSGKIQVNAQNINIKDGSFIVSAKIGGTGLSGDVVLTASNNITVDGIFRRGAPSGISSLFAGEPFIGRVGPSATKGAGDIRIQAKQIAVLNGALINADLLETEGRSGKIFINASEAVRVSGSGQGSNPRFTLVGRQPETITQIRSNISAGTVGLTSSPGGTINITSPRVVVEQDGIIDAITLSQGAGGNVNINSPQIELNSGGQILTSAFDRGAAGNVSVNASSIQIAGKSVDRASDEIPNSGIFASTAPTAQGQGGSVQLQTQNLVVKDDGRVSVSSQGKGIGGQLQVTANSVILRNQGRLLAETSSNTGGNILLNLSEILLLRRGASISTTAGTAQLGGDGGRIDIRAPFIVSVPGENSDIVANAFSGSGGQVNITAFNLLGIAPKTRIELEQLLNVNDPARLNPSLLPSNDITAISQTSPNLSGNISISQLDVDPTQAAARLPDDLLDRSNLINQSLCRITQGSQFVLTGRGGLPTPPTGQMLPLRLWEDARLTGMINASKTSKPFTTLRTSNKTPLTEAQSWYRSKAGKIRLTAYVKTAQNHWARSSVCTAPP